MMSLSHGDLCVIAKGFLMKSFSRGGHGCRVATMEPKISFLDGESPDAIGFRVSSPSYGGGSVVVECKTSRSDFLSDRKKPHRISPSSGMGRFRYYLCPKDMISREELPDGWGLLYLGSRKCVSVVCGAIETLQGTGPRDFSGYDFGQTGYNSIRETLLLSHLLGRVSDADAVHERLRNADRANAALVREIQKQKHYIHEQDKVIAREILARRRERSQ